MPQQYLPITVVLEAIKKELGLSDVKYTITSKQNRQGQTYSQAHFSRADNTPICQFVYCRLMKGVPYILAASFKDSMAKRDSYREDISVDDVMELLF